MENFQLSNWNSRRSRSWSSKSVCLAHTLYIDFYCASSMRIEIENPLRYRSSHLKSHLSTSVSISCLPSLSLSVVAMRCATHPPNISTPTRAVWSSWRWTRATAGGTTATWRHPALQLRRHRGRPQVSQLKNRNWGGWKCHWLTNSS